MSGSIEGGLDRERFGTVAPDAPGARLDQALAGLFPDLSRSRLKALVLDGRVRRGGEALRDPALKVGPGTELHLTLPEAAPAVPAPERIALTVAFEDEHLIVVDKPAGLVVHPAPGHAGGTLVNALIAHCGDSLSGIGGVRRPGIVHRLDKDTSGLMVVAKTDAAHRGLAAQFADHGRSGPLERAYAALAWGVPHPRRGTITESLARSRRNFEKVAVVPEGEGRHAVTHYAVERGYGELACLVRCRLETGRTHQIRVHLAHRGHPLLGDGLYGAAYRTKAARLPEAARGALSDLGRQALHAGLLGFAHPGTGEALRFESPLPPDMAALVAALAAG